MKTPATPEQPTPAPIRSKDGLACHHCKNTLLPVISKAEPVGVDGPVRATCHQCGKVTERYADQREAIFAWADGKWRAEQ